MAANGHKRQLTKASGEEMFVLPPDHKLHANCH
jgi:hypothetical protein